MKACPLCKLKYPDDRTLCFVDGATLAPIQDERIGTVLAGRYEIESVLGQGGMATVYTARHRLVDRLCAIKILNESFAKNEVMRERFRREAKAAQKLAHPNIIEISDQGETDDGCVYLVMELLEGETLADLLERGKISVSRALTIGIQIARALARAHDLQVIHRDLKPENIYLAHDPQTGTEVVKLLDFGIARSMQDARLTGAGEVFGTPQYMAPERITSIDAGPSADLYAVGIILFEMVTGRLPFDAAQVPVLFIKHLSEAAPSARASDPSIPEALDKLILELLAKDPKERPVDAHRLYKDLVAIAEAVGATVPRDLSEVPESLRPASKSLPPVAIDLWGRRVEVFRQMLEKVYGAGAPPQQVELLERINALVKQIASHRDEAMAHQRNLENVDASGREMRQRIGHAVHALGVDASLARDKLKDATAAAKLAAALREEKREAFREAQHEVLFWEGRTGFLEPYQEMADAYRAAADVVESWCEAKKQQAAADARCVASKHDVEDLEFQILQLRQAMATQEESLEREQTALQAQLESLGRAAGAMENDLLAQASRFCEPLRARPELGPLFRELESESDAAA
ncbi:MAG: serine/threonine-protein kinase [Polyangiaceae bacterium]|nr:serine/threonine-protein kinase [Polyangiaceae bacterium]